MQYLYLRRFSWLYDVFRMISTIVKAKRVGEQFLSHSSVVADEGQMPSCSLQLVPTVRLRTAKQEIKYLILIQYCT